MNFEKREKVKEKVADFTYGLLAGTVDVLLFFFFQGFNAKYGAPAMRKSIEDSMEEVMSLGVDKETVRRAIWKATHRKFIEKSSRKTIQITKEGLEKISRLIPSYRGERVWNGHFYLITYDIVEKKRHQRRLLREYLKKLGCGLLQDSVWLTPYNPKKVLQEFIQKNSLSGAIIVSDVGKDGGIGDEDLGGLVGRVYQLEEINKRYSDFIRKLRLGNLTKTEAHFQYLAILEDDPQLPFAILPYNWEGDKAYKLLEEKFFPNCCPSGQKNV